MFTYFYTIFQFYNVSPQNVHEGHVEVVTKNITLDWECKIAPFLSIKDFILQSQDVVDSTPVTSEVLTFVDSSEGDVDATQYLKNPIASSDATKNTSLAKFLSRPILIDTRTWSTSDLPGMLGAKIEPWFLFMNNTVAKNKLNNYAFLRAKLCVKFVINATPFHFGLLRVAYEPNVNAANTGSRSSSVRTNSVSDLPLVVPYSQLPGVWIHPADNSGGHLELPFFKCNNWLKLTSAADSKTMGALYYYITSILGVASSSGTPSVTVDTFAWLEDVELCASTARFVLQAKDEYDGVISAPASAIAAVAGTLSNVPIIGKFARATVIGAKAVSNIAAMFGYTNTPVIADIPARIPNAGPSLASSEIGAQIHKLTLDPKQELSIDPTLHGINSDDEMCIQNIVTRKSALAVIGWSTSDTMNTVIFNANVSPQLFASVPILDTGSNIVSRRVYHTPMSYVGMLFAHWRGDIIFDFEVVCTKFHKGRLKIGWDPLGDGGTVSLPENTVYTTILDIGENNKASIRVPYHQAYAFMRTRGIQRENWSVGNSLPSDDLFDNGLLIVSVLTPLVSPVSPQNITILVSVHGADNLEFANPRSSLSGYGNPPPSFYSLQAKDEIDIHSSQEDFGDSGSQHPQRYALNFGECVPSLRTLLHRMSVYDTSWIGTSSATRFIRYEKSFGRLPYMYGFDPSGQSSAAKTLSAGFANFSYVPTHPITYISMMYGGFRGSVNYSANICADLTPYVGDVRVSRVTDWTNPSKRRGAIASTINSGTGGNATALWLNYQYHSGTAGAAFTNTITNGAINWCQPMMSGVNFNFTDPTYAINGNITDQTNLECSFLEITFKQQVASTTTEVATITTYAGAGVDFTCLWWLCCPTLDYYVNNPSSV